jgi:chloramphenicol-sensitive protein RarD
VSGFWSGVAAYTIWGLVPIYWKLLKHVPGIQVLGHRIVWSLAVLIILVAAMRRGGRATFGGGRASLAGGRATLGAVSSRVVGLYAIAAVLIAVNWFLYIYAVNAGFIVETSLGYYITPLVNVLFGVVVFHERMRPAQWVAIVIAAAGVVQLTFAYGALPWIAFGLAASFGSYGLAKKKAPLGPVEGLTLETAILAPVAILFLVMLHRSGDGAFLRTGATSDALLIGGGLVTTVPLLLFAAAVRTVPLSVIGILQYIGPTLQFLLGVFVYHEPFSRTQLIGFSIVWTALAIYAGDSLRARAATSVVPTLDEGMV